MSFCKIYARIKLDVININLLDYLKEIKVQLQRSKQNISENPKQDSFSKNTDEDNFEIIIENNHNLYDNEQEIIKKGAHDFLENGNINSFEEGIITFAIMIRGLRYKKTEKDENGHIKIILEDVKLEHLSQKKL